MRVSHIPDLKEYADENGRCSKLAADNRTCTIYNERPLVCRIDEMGSLVRLHPSTWREINLMSCEVLHQEVHSSPLESEGSTCSHVGV